MSIRWTDRTAMPYEPTPQTPGVADHAAPKETNPVTTFAVDTTERAVKTFAQALAAYFGAGAINVLSADWGEALTVSVTAAFLSALSSLASLKLGHKGTASATDAVVPAPRS